MIDLFFIHDFILVILCDLEVRVLIVRGPVGRLHLADPLVGARHEPRRLHSVLALGEPVIDVREVVRLEPPIHGLNPVPWHVPTRCEGLTPVYFHDMAVDSPRLLRRQEDNGTRHFLNGGDSLKRDVRSRSLFKILILFFTHARVAVQVRVDCRWGHCVHTDAQGGQLQGCTLSQHF